MDLEKLSKKKWNIEHYDGCPAFTEMTARGFTRKPNSKIPVYGINLSYYSKGQGDWMSLYSGHKKIGSAIVEIFIKDENDISCLYKIWLGNFKTLLKKFYEWLGRDLTILSDKQLLKWIDDVYDYYSYVSIPGFIDGYMFYADKRFDFLIKQYCAKNNITNHPQIFSILSAPVDSSFINEEEYDLHKIGAIIKKKGFKNGSLKQFVNNKEELADMLEDHLKKYFWIKSSYAGYNKYSFEEMEKEIKISVKQRKIDSFLTKNKKEKEKLFKKYKFTTEIIAIAKLTEILIKWQDQRKIYTLTFVALANKILREIGDRTNVDYELLKYSYSKEFSAILRNKFKTSELRKRREASLFIYKKGNIISIITGKEAKDFLQKVSVVDIKGAEEITGITASLGRAMGKVKIIMSSKYIEKVEKGDILVAPMTRPEHLAGMKKAAAIVTDDGGITCHAAIVARELGIPCIIGTKIATKVLKDGDVVEVDAGKGEVRIIK